MRLQFLLITFLQVAVVKCLREVSGYLGDTIILPSGADPSWNLSKVVWSVFSNNTWIATYRSGRTNTERFHWYIGRLGLNISSGDLVMQNLNSQDAIEYSVDLYNTEGQVRVNKIKLIVKERLQKPTVEAVPSKSIKGGCWAVLHCFSTDEGVELTWQANPPGVTVLNTNDGAVLLAFLNSTQKDAEFTCTSSRNTENASRGITPKCDADSEDKPQPEPTPLPHTRTRNSAFVVMGGFLGGSLTVILIYSLKEKNQSCLGICQRETVSNTIFIKIWSVKGKHFKKNNITSEDSGKICVVLGL